MSIVKVSSIGIKESHKGRLHQHLGIPEGEKIPVSLIEEKLKTEKDPSIRRQLNYALMAKTRWHHKGVQKTAEANEIIDSTAGELKVEWSNKTGKDSKLFEYFKELFEKLNDDKIKKFSVTISGKTYNINKDSFYMNYKTLNKKVTSIVNKHYSDPSSDNGDVKGPSVG